MKISQLTKRALASRANGARSKGPTTEEGKQRAAMNARRHGLLSKITVVPGESQEVFGLLLDQFRTRFNPANGVEDNHVEEMVASVWKLRRLWAIENRLFAQAIAQRPELDELDCLTEAFRDLAKGPELHLLLRYQAKHERAYDKALQHFLLTAEPIPPETTPPETTPPETAPETTMPQTPESAPATTETPAEASPQSLQDENAKRTQLPVTHPKVNDIQIDQSHLQYRRNWLGPIPQVVPNHDGANRPAKTQTPEQHTNTKRT